MITYQNGGQIILVDLDDIHQHSRNVHYAIVINAPCAVIAGEVRFRIAPFGKNHCNIQRCGIHNFQRLGHIADLAAVHYSLNRRKAAVLSGNGNRACQALHCRA